jgi:hypothetical protein
MDFDRFRRDGEDAALSRPTTTLASEIEDGCP